MNKILNIERELEKSRASVSQMADELRLHGQTCAILEDGLHAAILLKEHGHTDFAAEVFRRLLKEWPKSDQLWYEYIQFLRRGQRDTDADNVLLDTITQRVIGENILREFMFRSLADLQTSAQASKAILKGAIFALTQFASPYTIAIANYLSSIDLSALFKGMNAIAFESLEMIQQECVDAVQRKRAFCLIRLGDGEGAFLHAVPFPPAQAPLFHSHREYFTSRWYGDAGLASDERFLSLARELGLHLAEADVLGIPQLPWITHEIGLRNMRATVGCLEIARLAQSIALASATKLTTTTVSVDLEFRGLFKQLFSVTTSVMLITCHSGLERRLEAVGVKRVRRVVIIPPAHSDLAATGYSCEESHFRDSFPNVIEAIDSIPRGELVLIGAGFLGKVYALRVKQRGGIGLDLGSLFDLWMGHLTRPSFHQLGHLALLKDNQGIHE